MTYTKTKYDLPTMPSLKKQLNKLENHVRFIKTEIMNVTSTLEGLDFFEEAELYEQLSELADQARIKVNQKINEERSKLPDTDND